jgi:hypothetical protein
LRALFAETEAKEKAAQNLPHKLTVKRIEEELLSLGLPKKGAKEKKKDIVARLEAARGLPPSFSDASKATAEVEVEDEEEEEEAEEGSDTEALDSYDPAAFIPVPDNPLSFMKYDPISLRVLKEHPLLQGKLLEELKTFASGGARGEQLQRYINEEFGPISTNTHIVEGSFCVGDVVMYKKGKLTSEHVSGEQRNKLNVIAPVRKAAYNQPTATGIKKRKNPNSKKPTVDGLKRLLKSVDTEFHNEEALLVAAVHVKEKKKAKKEHKGEGSNMYTAKVRAQLAKKRRKKKQEFDPKTQALKLHLPLPTSKKTHMVVKPSKYELLKHLQARLAARKEWPEKDWTTKNAATFPPAFRKLGFLVTLINNRSWFLPYDVLCVIFFWLWKTWSEEDLLLFEKSTRRHKKKKQIASM